MRVKLLGGSSRSMSNRGFDVCLFCNSYPLALLNGTQHQGKVVEEKGKNVAPETGIRFLSEVSENPGQVVEGGLSRQLINYL